MCVWCGVVWCVWCVCVCVPTCVQVGDGLDIMNHTVYTSPPNSSLGSALSQRMLLWKTFSHAHRPRAHAQCGSEDAHGAQREIQSMKSDLVTRSRCEDSIKSSYKDYTNGSGRWPRTINQEKEFPLTFLCL